MAMEQETAGTEYRIHIKISVPLCTQICFGNIFTVLKEG